MAGILDFFSPESGQRRRAALDQLGRSAEYYVPPELRQLLGFAAEMTPSATIDRAAAAGGRMMAPDRTPMQRVGDFGGMLSETAGVVAPMAVAGRAGMPVAQAVQEGLLGFSAGADDVGRRFVERMNQPGPVPTMYSNPLGGRVVGDIDARVAAARQAVLDNPNDASLFSQYKALRKERDALGSRPVDAPVAAPLNELESYAGSHRAPTRGEYGSSLDDPTVMFGGDDIYTRNAAQYFGHGDPRMDRESIRAINAARGNPDAEITVYRAVPKGLEGAQVNAGDWVTPSRAYAETHGQGPLRGDYQIIEQKVRAGDLFTEGDIHEWGYSPPSTTFRSLNPAEQMAKDILDLRAAGRAGEVTEEMMAQADPQYMFANTPLPMDEASRMARALEQGRRDEFHGTTTGSDMVAPDAFRGSGTRQGIGFVTSDNPYVASSYADPSFGSVFPMLNTPLPSSAPRIDVGGNVWSDISVDAPVTLGDRVVTARDLSMEPADVGGVLSTNQLSRGASFDSPGIEFTNIMDRSIHAPRPRTDDGMEIMREFQRLASDPSNVTMRQDTRGMRSRFARFDPEFRHLRNLSAGVGGLGLLSTMLPQEEQY